MILFKGKKYKYIHTMDITLDHIRAVFFPKGFHEKYKYLGAVPWKEDSKMFKAIEPLVIFMNSKVKPWWCPGWFLRFLHLFGSDNSIVRIRNHKLHNLEKKITGGYMIVDYKTKWTDYDLRISISGDKQCYDLVSAIEHRFYTEGKREDLVDQIKELDPETKFHKGHSLDVLQNQLNILEDEHE